MARLAGARRFLAEQTWCWPSQTVTPLQPSLQSFAWILSQKLALRKPSCRGWLGLGLAPAKGCTTPTFPRLPPLRNLKLLGRAGLEPSMLLQGKSGRGWEASWSLPFAPSPLVLARGSGRPALQALAQPGWSSPFGLCCPTTPRHTRTSFSGSLEKKGALWLTRHSPLPPNRACLSGLVALSREKREG